LGSVLSDSASPSSLLVCFSVSLLRGSPRGAAIEVSCRVVSERLLLDFDAFYIEHHRCGELDAGIENPPIVWFQCGCAARIVRWVTAYHG
jgi:hypothetical protein